LTSPTTPTSATRPTDVSAVFAHSALLNRGPALLDSGRDICREPDMIMGRW
jgi:hypothetical protein